MALATGLDCPIDEVQDAWRDIEVRVRELLAHGAHIVAASISLVHTVTPTHTEDDAMDSAANEAVVGDLMPPGASGEGQAANSAWRGGAGQGSNAPPRDRAPGGVVSCDELDVAWPDYVRIIGQQEDRALWPGWTVRGYVDEAEACQDAFRKFPHFAAMPPDIRRRLAGWDGDGIEYFGNMAGAGWFKHATKSAPEPLSAALDLVPLEGTVALAIVRQFLERVTALRGIDMGAATRMLTIKRPDEFLPVNSASRPAIHRVFGQQARDAKGYAGIIERIRSFPWYGTPEPGDATEGRMWRCRVGLLDAIFCDPPANR